MEILWSIFTNYFHFQFLTFSKLLGERIDFHSLIPGSFSMVLYFIVQCFDVEISLFIETKMGAKAFLAFGIKNGSRIIAVR